MSDPSPDLHMLNVVVGDMAASLEFYRRLGIDVPDGEDDSPHVQVPAGRRPSTPSGAPASPSWPTPTATTSAS